MKLNEFLDTLKTDKVWLNLKVKGNNEFTGTLNALRNSPDDFLLDYKIQDITPSISYSSLNLDINLIN